MRIAAVFAFIMLLVVGVATSVAAEPPPADKTNTCSTVFVAGKGVIDSCTGARSSNSRVYPRKPGVPPEGCVDVCPDAVQATATPDPSGTSKPQGTTRAVSTPVSSVYTAPIETTPTAAAPEAAPQNCDRVSYPDICVPPAPPYLSCADIPDRNFRVRAPDPHRFDADGNGIGCEEIRGPSIGR